MPATSLAVLGLALLFATALGVWVVAARQLDLRVHLTDIPPRMRRRVLWWQANAAHAEVGALAVAALAATAYLSSRL